MDTAHFLRSTRIRQVVSEHALYLEVLENLGEAEREAEWHGWLTDEQAQQLETQRDAIMAMIAQLEAVLAELPSTCLADVALKARVVSMVMDGEDGRGAEAGLVNSLCRDLIALEREQSQDGDRQCASSPKQSLSAGC